MVGSFRQLVFIFNMSWWVAFLVVHANLNGFYLKTLVIGLSLLFSTDGAN